MVIKGKVAEVLDKFRVVVNVGEDDGVEEGMLFEIYEKKGGYTDPETGENLGSREVVKGHVEVVELYEKMSVLESAETESYNPIATKMSIFGSKRTKKLSTDDNLESDETKISRGDDVREIEDTEDVEE
jgi:hypothetical protein